jgi:hypothetical protein
VLDAWCPEFNPALDRNGSIATVFVRTLELGLRRVPQP